MIDKKFGMTGNEAEEAFDKTEKLLIKTHQTMAEIGDPGLIDGSIDEGSEDEDRPE